MGEGFCIPVVNSAPTKQLPSQNMNKPTRKETDALKCPVIISGQVHMTDRALGLQVSWIELLVSDISG